MKIKKTTKSFTDDYSFCKDENCKIDMVLSGKFLTNRDLKIDINKLNIDEYPNSERIDYLRKLISKRYNKSYENFVIGAASNGIIQNLVKLFFSRGGTLLVSDFSFAQPEYAVNRIGGKVKKVSVDENFKINFDDLYNNIDENVKAVFLCNPNNPTGFYYNPTDIINFASKTAVPVIVSEAAIEFTKSKSLLDFELPENIIVTRTFSKAYGLAGLRIGYAYMSGKYLDLYSKNITRFEVSMLSIEIAIQMLENNSIHENINMVISERNYLQRQLEALNIPTLKSTSNAFMSLKMYSNDFFELLKSKGITVAKIDSKYKDYYYIRIAVQSKEINSLFIQELNNIGREILKRFEKSF